MRLKFLILCFLLPLPTAAQDFIPLVQTYLSKDYGAGRQNWCAGNGPGDLVYFGNDDGLLCYDGNEWTLARLPHGKIVRSMLCDGNRIYVGTFEEFGFFSPSENGSLKYTSISERLPDYNMDNDEIWRIVLYGDKVIFQAFRSYFAFDGKSVEATHLDEFCLFFSSFGGKIYTNAEKSGPSAVDPSSGAIIPLKVPFKSQLIAVDSLPDGKGIAATSSDGLFLFDGQSFTPFRTTADDVLRKASLNRLYVDTKGNIVVGTRLAGVLFFSPEGKLLSWINQGNALPGNSVQGLVSDREKNVWVALDGGIAMISGNSSLSVLTSMKPNVGEIFTAAVIPPRIYLGTNQGLYIGAVSKDLVHITDIKRIDSVRDYVLNISILDSQLFCGSNAGTYELNGDFATEVCPVTGGAWFERGIIGGQEVLVEATYTFLCVYLKKDGRWTFSHTVEGFMEPLDKVIVNPDGTLYARHIHGKVYLIKLSEDLRKAEEIKELPGEEIPPLVRNRSKGIPNLPEGYREAFRLGDSLRLCVSNNSLALLRDKEKEEALPPTLGLKRIRISDVSTEKDSLISLSTVNPGIHYRMRNLEFSLLWPEFTAKTAFKTRLAGLDKIWQPASANRTWKYRYLSPGHYVFNVIAVSIEDDSTLSTLEYPFTVMQPWYWSLVAKICYLALLIATIYFMISYLIRKEHAKREAREKAFTAEKTKLENKVRMREQELNALTIEIMRTDWCRKLNNRYPSLSPNDLKFCTYLRMNLSSKDIASIQNITLKGVEAARARIRRKLGLPSNESLTAFLIKFN